MLKYKDYMVTFREFPDEVTLSFSITGCPFRCKGCHSPELREDIGTPLDADALVRLLDSVNGVSGFGVTCVGFLGGDWDIDNVIAIAEKVKRRTDLKVGIYSGMDELPDHVYEVFDYVKTGPYVEALGALDSPTTNQRMWRVDHSMSYERGYKKEDITEKMRHSDAL